MNYWRSSAVDDGLLDHSWVSVLIVFFSFGFLYLSFDLTAIKLYDDLLDREAFFLPVPSLKQALFDRKPLSFLVV
jgi:hypothetical protein